MSWPAGIRTRGEVRTQYAHAIDMVPTVLDVLGLEAPTSIKGVTQAVWIVGNVFVVGEIPSSQTQFVDSSTNRSKPDYALTVLEN